VIGTVVPSEKRVYEAESSHQNIFQEVRIMAKKPAIHTVPHGGGWANRREGAARVSKVFPTKAAAQAAGRETARRERTEHIIHKKDGEIGSRNSYGNDPHPKG
jgi:N-methylhydantoinase A/oxoprolinase/acetone carboxylase beta subunit